MSDEAKPLKWSRALPYCARCGSVQPQHTCVFACCVCGREGGLYLRQDRLYCLDHLTQADRSPVEEEPITGEIVAGEHNQLELLEES